MRILQIFSVIFIFLITACNNTSNESTTDNSKPVNALLPTEVVVRDLFLFHPLDEDWLKGFDFNKFIEDISAAAQNEKIKVYDYFGMYEINPEPMSLNDLKINLTGGVDTVEIEDPETNEISIKVFERTYPREEINQIFFKENWMLEKDAFKLKKNVTGYGIVREFERQYGEEIKTVKKILFELYFDNSEDEIKDKELLAENIKYEFSLENFEYVKNLDHEKFMRILIDKIDSGDVKAYDFYDNSKQISFKEIKTSMGLTNDTIMIEDPQTFELIPRIIEHELTPDLFGSYIFIENWYIDRSNYKIIKEVKGIAPVYFFYRDDNELSKKIPFVVWF